MARWTLEKFQPDGEHPLDFADCLFGRKQNDPVAFMNDGILIDPLHLVVAQNCRDDDA